MILHYIILHYIIVHNIMLYYIILCYIFLLRQRRSRFWTFAPISAEARTSLRRRTPAPPADCKGEQKPATTTTPNTRPRLFLLLFLCILILLRVLHLLAILPLPYHTCKRDVRKDDPVDLQWHPHIPTCASNLASLRGTSFRLVC